jgi:alkanesulfonate monooxygenase SsuD/methylene tetrahydromethanopterin reductase-like flavin-dependent oxidoreductase (luciferase family)
VQIRSAFVWDEGGDVAWNVVRDGLAHASGVYDGWAAGGDMPDTGFVLPELDEAAARASTPVGTPKEVAHALRPFAEAFGGRGDFTLVVRLHYPGMDYETASHAVELFGEHVIPALKGA